MPALVAGIHVFALPTSRASGVGRGCEKDGDGRDKPGHDGGFNGLDVTRMRSAFQTPLSGTNMTNDIDLNADETATAAWIARFLKARGVDRIR